MSSIRSVSSSKSSTNWTLSIISAQSSVTGSSSVCLNKVRFNCPELRQFTHLNKFSSLSNCCSSSSSDSCGSSFSMFSKQLYFSNSRKFISCVCNISSDIFLSFSYGTWENIRRCNEQVSCVLSLQQYLQY